eukprot:CAMPEP_0185033646 /NCGR_PEP_ID=MMETSP1103-20130426/22777_1 /TAXON_ID=36769 /ORGANISM="Paraphysomonas bandaiensis, Strain Caron Lab Isolate" /LENGTH=426 /DNA_ID=CAMNT_0027569991 /DNA_START=25 /DNA_END=1302 /DNA_ORIENTATION=-
MSDNEAHEWNSEDMEDVDIRASESGDVRNSSSTVTSRPVELVPISTDNLQPEFPRLAHVDSRPIVLHILEYLTAAEICNLSNVSRSLYVISQAPVIWKSLLLMDFSFEDSEVATIRDTPNTVPERLCSSPIDTELAVASKAFYARQLRVVQSRINRAKEAKLRLLQECAVDRRIRVAECCLDSLMVRSFVPLPAGCIFVTLLMVALRADGLDVSIWFCLLPVLFLLTYHLFTVGITCLLHRYRHTSTASLALWTHLSSPAQYFYTHIASESVRAAQGACLVSVLLLLQMVVIGLKVASSTPTLLHESFSWGLVFTPLWMIFSLYLLLPVLGIANGNPGAYVAGLVFFWVPFFVLFVTLAVKLDGEESGQRSGRLRLALILIPFWIIEGIAMLGTLIGFLTGLQRYYRGFLDRENLLERGGVCAVFW